jgi:heterodisulfide reductase subunit C
MVEYEKGTIHLRSYYVIDKETGKIIPIYLTSNAVMRESCIGNKAGNPLIDKINEELEKSRLIKKLKLFNQIKELESKKQNL